MPARRGPGGGPESDETEPSRPRREGRGDLFVYSVPGLTWADLDRLDLPALEAFARAAPPSPTWRPAASPTAPRPATPTSPSRPAPGPTGDDADRRPGAPHRRGPGRRAASPRSSSAAPAPVPRRLGGARLARAGAPQRRPALRRRARRRWPRRSPTPAIGIASVIGNADGTDELGGPTRSIQRQVGLALADTDGVVAAGELDTDLLTADPAGAFGLRLDLDRGASPRSTSRGWPRPATGRRRWCMVEASDLARTMRYRPLVDERALRTSCGPRRWPPPTSCSAELLDRVDPTQDSVLLVAPYNREPAPRLTVVAPHAARGASPATCARPPPSGPGIVTLVDVAPSILDLRARPARVDGGPALRGGAPTATPRIERIDHLVSVNAASRFRENLLTPTTIALVLVLGRARRPAVAMVAGRRLVRPDLRRGCATSPLVAAWPRSRRRTSARAFPLEDLGIGFYWAFLVASSLAVAAGRHRSCGASPAAARRRSWPCSSLMVGGARRRRHARVEPQPQRRVRLLADRQLPPLRHQQLQLRAAGRGRVPARRVHRRALARPGGAASAPSASWSASWSSSACPIWGSDVGGVLAFTPAILVFAAMLLGHTGSGCASCSSAGVATVAAVTAFGFLDLARPPEQRAHLGRLFERIGNEGLEPLLSIMERKLLANLRVSTSSFWVLAIPIGVVFWAVPRPPPHAP